MKNNMISSILMNLQQCSLRTTYNVTMTVIIDVTKFRRYGFTHIVKGTEKDMQDSYD